ncbi:hypothetical protein CPB83DRAFT_847814, partial [Crepidotus variabilis]
MSTTVTIWNGADCTGSRGPTTNLNAPVCGTLGSGSVKSIQYSGVPNKIEFYVSGGAHDNCSNGSQASRGGGSGCVTAPAGFNWESVRIT